MDNIIKLRDLTKSYEEKKVVDCFSLSIEKGHIYGLVGPNGAGKTTIMKMIAGLRNPDDGVISLFGESTNLDEVRSKISFMIETPYIDNMMTAKDNMEYVSAIFGIHDHNKIDELLEFMGVSDTGDKKAGKFSLGMKQRLGIAMALIPEPEVMVLDEPMNGLDPEGIVDIRKKLLMLSKKKNKTILISSHQLSELYELCTDFAFIYQGKLLENISKAELEVKFEKHLVIQVNRMAELQEVCKSYNLLHTKMIEDDLHIYDAIDSIEDFSKFVYDSGLIVTKLHYDSEKLEDYYLKKVGAINEQHNKR